MIVGIAAMMFVCAVRLGRRNISTGPIPTGKVQLALFTSFILGIVCGYKTKQ